jgi:hypothetical protein
LAKKPEDQYNDEEAKQRLVAALRGARIAGHKPMESLTQKKSKVKKATKNQQSKKGDRL